MFPLAEFRTHIVAPRPVSKFILWQMIMSFAHIQSNLTNLNDRRLLQGGL
ncbi:hypothetical protein SCH4B_0322 [Ruegeria sp. TrichCH4B]|nr:hypothetical protein SCH4B_0322 [Ruegeria sp. TrichCH4B]